MTVFEKAWDITKRYIPGWRNEAKAQGLLDILDDPFTLYPYDAEFFIDADGNILEDWEVEEAPHKYHDFLGAGTRMAAFKHPLNTNYVVKVPFDTEWTLSEYAKRNQSNKLIEALERLGYPIVGELQSRLGSPLSGPRRYTIPHAFNVQPRLQDYYTYRNNFTDWNAMNEEYSVAHNVLAGLFGDRHKDNFGFDSLGYARLLDGEHLGSESWKNHVESAEEWQNFIGEQGIQHPASQLIDFIDVLQDSTPDMAHRHRLDSVRNFMEAIEPHSDNPKTLTIEGRPKYLEGY